MREKLNSNPVAQVALIAVLLLATGYFVVSTMGGGEEESESTGSSTSAVTAVTAETATAPVSLDDALAQVNGAAAAPPLPDPVLAAWDSGQTLALLFVHDDGIDDRMVAGTTARLEGLPDVASFVVPAEKISRYAAITEGVGVDRVPALVVVRPKRLEQAIPTASVSYGFQSPQSVAQAVIDAGYEGPTVDYHP
jgi:hypothetical protein